MSTKRQTIGRTFSAPVLNSEAEPEAFKQVFTLSSGRKVVFTKVIVPAVEVEAKTYVTQEVNGRDQSALTPESLQDITRTISLQQFFPAIGVRRDNRIEILDGSRRRASAILKHVGLDILVTDEPLSVSEARKLAQDIQTAREHNIREVGTRLLALKQSGLTQKEIAEAEGLSQAKVTRALQAASVSSELLSLFPIQSELSFSDYKVLLTAEELLASKQRSVSELIENIIGVVSGIREPSLLAADEVKTIILTVIRDEATVLGEPEKGEAVVITPLWQFSDKNKYARKKVRGRSFSYEFNRVSPELQGAIDDVVNAVLAKYLKS
ncbi:MAG: ParB family protein [Serratia sp. (in: enterobacteria)]|uniref:ParB family protein n=1 Tax=Serratia sp. (in: enterobacteria) TaxID=616 RepID=UPI003F3D7C6E